MNRITELAQLGVNLPENQRSLFNRIFEVSTYTGHLSIPDSFRKKVVAYFSQGSETEQQTIERISSQIIVGTFNRYTYEGALFNELRACKPGNKPEGTDKLRKAVLEYIEREHEEEIKKYGLCDLCHPVTHTPLDLPKRLERNGHVTIANAAKYDAANGMIVFRQYNPLEFGQEDFCDWMDLASMWFDEMNKQNPELVYPFLIWNCLPRAGASKIHGHMHVLLTGSFPYEGVKRLRLASQKYKSEGGDYFDDLASVHREIGAGFPYKGRDVMAYLTPAKDKETLVLAKTFEDLKEPTFKVIRCFIEKLGVLAFNLGIQMPPLNEEPGWDDFRYVARVVDRGNPLKHGTDFAGMELFGSKVIGSDPFRVADALENCMAT